MGEHDQLFKNLVGIVGSKYVSDDDFILLSYTKDVGTFEGRPQGFVVRPEKTEEVVEIVRLANYTRTPVMPLGGKCSVLGVPPGQPGRGIVVDMRRMCKMIDIDEENMTVTAECGITLGEMASKVNEKGYDIHTANMPHFNATLGGHTSSVPNAGYGAWGASVGWNYHYVLGFKVVLPDGTILETGAGPGSQSGVDYTVARGFEGPDTTGLFIGDGGTFGIKTEATYRMFRLPKFKKGGARAFDTIDQAYKAYHKLHEIDTYLYMQPWAAGMIFDPETITFATMGMTEPTWHICWVNVGNSEEEVDFKNKQTDKICEEGGGRPGTPAANEFMDSYFRMARDMGRMATFGNYTSSCFEYGVDRRHLLEAFKWEIEFANKGIERYGIDKSKIRMTKAFLASATGYGMTSIILYFDPCDAETSQKVHALNLEAMKESMARGYIQIASMGYGGPLKAKYWSPQLYHYLLTLKRTLDPNNIMNPGIFFP